MPNLAPKCIKKSEEYFATSFSENMGVSRPEFMRNQSIIYRAIKAWQAAEIGYDEGILSEITFNLLNRDARTFITATKEVGTLEMCTVTLDETPA